MSSIPSRIERAWNAFVSPNYSYKDLYSVNAVTTSTFSNNRYRSNDRSIVTALYNRIAMDVASIQLKHCMVDKNDRMINEVNDELNERLTGKANIDQTARTFIQNVVMTMLDTGHAVIVPIDTSSSPMESSSYDIYTWRVGTVVQWFPQDVLVKVYNDRTGEEVQLHRPKDSVCILENPLYSVMNGSNSTVNRLIRKLNMLDAIDEQSSSGKLDLIIQLPYVVKTEARKQQAEARRAEIERQLSNTKYGIAYTDGTERVTQLNRSIENNLLNQIQYLTTMLYGQMGISEAVFNGTAADQEMVNYNNRTIEPIISTICDGLNYSFLSKTARTQGHRIKFFRDPFRLVPTNNLSTIIDALIRDQVITANEARSFIGLETVDDPNADVLANPGMPVDKTLAGQNMGYDQTGYDSEYDNQEMPQEGVDNVEGSDQFEQ